MSTLLAPVTMSVIGLEDRTISLTPEGFFMLSVHNVPVVCIPVHEIETVYFTGESLQLVVAGTEISVSVSAHFELYRLDELVHVLEGLLGPVPALN